jgi:hypothetical protein
MTNWQHAIYQSVESLATGEGSDFGYAGFASKVGL